jgi:hypothetical protein
MMVLIVTFALAVQMKAETGAIPVTLQDLIEHPINFDGKLIQVRGFIAFENQPRHAPAAMLYSTENDAVHLNSENSILLVPNLRMIHEEQEIDHRYVSLTGTLHVIRASNGSTGRVIKDIVDCVWSKSTKP